MRKSIKGRVALPKEVWSALASANRDFVNSLEIFMRDFDSQATDALRDGLKKLRDDHAAYAQIAAERFSKTKRGRPAKVTANAEAKRGPGRPRKHAIDVDVATFKAIEYPRVLASINKAPIPTIVSAVDAFNAEVANDAGKVTHTYIKAKRAATLSAYQRGKRRLKKNQNPD